MSEYDCKKYEELKAKLYEIEKEGKGALYLFYLAIFLCLFPVVSIIGIIICGYLIEMARKSGLLYGYYCGKIDEMTSSDNMFDTIKDGHLQ